jgi:hypothetical protein
VGALRVFCGLLPPVKQQRLLSLPQQPQQQERMPAAQQQLQRTQTTW